MKNVLFVFMFVLVPILSVSAVEAKCNTTCKTNEALAKNYFKINKDTTFSLIGANNKSLRIAKANKWGTKEQREKIETEVNNANAFLKKNKVMRDRDIKQVFGINK